MKCKFVLASGEVLGAQVVPVAVGVCRYGDRYFGRMASRGRDHAEYPWAFVESDLHVVEQLEIVEDAKQPSRKNAKGRRRVPRNARKNGVGYSPRRR